MKFFTRKWCGVEYDLEQSERLSKDYYDNLARILRHLPKPVRHFLKDVNIHDGLFRKVVFHACERRLAMKLRCGDLQVGYYDVDMVFQGVLLSPEDRRQLRLTANRRKTEVLWDEVDMPEKGTFEYRFICWPEGEVSIRFRDFSYRKTPVKDRKFVAANPRFRVVK